MEEKNELQRCISILKAGGLIVAPSDTVYGLLCDATNEEAVKNLIKIKNRPFGKPISVFVADFKMLEEYADGEDHTTILHTLLPGPFTVILPSKKKVVQLLESERGTLGVRLPKYDFITRLVALFGKPLTATSANISGRPPHYEASGFLDELSNEKRKYISYVVDYGKLPHNKSSTILNFSGSSIELLRKGDIVPLSQTQFFTESPSETKKIANYITGKYIFYATSKPLIIILKGEMGVGKTIFAKGIGEYLSVKNIISPTYVVYYEYEVKKENVKKLIHADLFNIEEESEFDYLGLEDYFKKDIVICIEWGEKMGTLFEKLKKNAKVVFIEMEYKNEKDRVITVNEL